MRVPEEVKDWLRKAEADYAGALHLQRIRKMPLPDLVCFHCQQAAEKYLKPFLVFQEAPFPKTHDLLSLLELCQEYRTDFALWSEPFELLNPYSVQFRYPGEATTRDEAKFAVKTIKKIKEFKRMLFPKEVWPVD